MHRALLAALLSLALPCLAATPLLAVTAADLDGTWLMDAEATLAEYDRAGLIPHRDDAADAALRAEMLAQLKTMRMTLAGGTSTFTTGTGAAERTDRGRYTVDRIDGDLLHLTAVGADGTVVGFTATLTRDAAGDRLSYLGFAAGGVPGTRSPTLVFVRAP